MLRILAAVMHMELQKSILLFVMGGVLYYSVELLWRGRSHISMFVDGGVCFVLIGLLNEAAPGLPLSVQAVLGAVIISGSELLAGLIVNRWLGLCVWDYSAVRGNVLGQVCLPFFAAWMPLSILASVTDDFLRLLIFHEPWPGIVLF